MKVSYAGFGEDALNDMGKGAYQGGKNQYFGLLCGNQVVSSYKRGASLVVSLNISFSSTYQKNQWGAKAGGKFGDLFSASVDIGNIAKESNLSGNV